MDDRLRDAEKRAASLWERANRTGASRQWTRAFERDPITATSNQGMLARAQFRPYENLFGAADHRCAAFLATSTNPPDQPPATFSQLR